MARKLQNLRNIGIIAHIDAGKTTLTERMLFYSGFTHRMGEVDKGTTKTDFDEEEQQRGITIYAAAITFDWKDITVNLIDTPGHVDFTAEVERCLRVLDGGVVVFSAREGVEAQSETVWRQADRYGVPRIAMINKMDREGADFKAVVKEIEERLEANPVVLQIPLGAGPPHVDDAFRGIIDLVSMKLLTFGEAGKTDKVTVAEIPEDHLERAEEARSALLERLYDYSNELMELGLEEAEVPEKLLKQVIRDATVHRLIVPLFCGSALDCIGVQPVLDAVADYLPSPADMPPVEGVDPQKKDQTVTRKPSPDEPFCGLVFKVQAEKHGDLAYVRVYSGKLTPNTRLLNPGKDTKDNAAQLWHIQPGGKESQVDEVTAGDIVGVIGLRHSVTGDTICDTRHPILLEQIRFPETVISMAIEPESSTERKKLADTLELMKRQDPTFRAIEYEETGQTLISGMGELHLEVIKHRLLRDFNLDVKVHKPRVSYRETVQKGVDVVGECRRQIAGQDTFARLAIRLEPIKDGNQPLRVALRPIEGVALPLAEAAREELEMLATGGGHYGFPLTRVRIQITGGEGREGESTEAAFRIAAGDAFDKALSAGGVVLLEPIMKLEIATPEENLGDIIANLQQKRALIHSTDPRGRNTVIKAEAPLASLFGFAGELRGLSQGRASCSMEPAAYGPAPPEVLDGLV
ncbi:MAG: elongation factor G [Planctomycetota bacterium]|nr:MAG: elongation factor G [Planctomycetota bacterium]REJ97181.1 MAG: elongation factor G [Planctomycetota bacterium]